MSKDYVMQLEATIQNLRRDNQLLKEAKDKQEQVLNEALKLNGEWAEELDNYKDLEEQLGCPLEKLIKFSTQLTVYTIYGVHTNEIVLIDFSLNRIHITKNRDLNNIYTLYIDDYKKTWWLKEDRSEQK